jgi:glycosyltransferase involved in cell wall biosynthesis
LYEGTPTILMEAMAMAKAVVATRVGAVPEVIVDGDNGISVAANDGRALADAIEPLLSDAALRARLGRRARETAELSLSREAMIEGYLAVFGREYERHQR